MGSFDFDRRNSWSRSFTSVLAMAPVGQGTADPRAGGQEPTAGGGQEPQLRPPTSRPPSLTLFALLLVSKDEQLLLEPLLLQLLLPLLLPLPLLLQLLLPLGCQHLLLLLQGQWGGRVSRARGRAQRSGSPGPRAHLEVLLQLDLMLPGQVVMLLLELSEQELLLQLLLLLERQELLLQLLLPQRGVHGARQSPPQLHGAGAASSPAPHGAGHGSWQHRLHLYCGEKNQEGISRPSALGPGCHAWGPESY